MFPFAQRFVERVVLVEDEDIKKAQQSLWRVLRVASEAGGAAAMAALLSGAYRPQPGERVGVLLCGANTDAVNL
jgi:threonine dehydratase